MTFQLGKIGDFVNEHANSVTSCDTSQIDVKHSHVRVSLLRQHDLHPLNLAMVDSQIGDVIPMAKVVKERFHAETNCVFYFEGYQMPGNLEDYRRPGNIFAFRGIGNNEIERRLFVKAYPTMR
jgi:hypothetical protein